MKKKCVVRNTSKHIVFDFVPITFLSFWINVSKRVFSLHGQSNVGQLWLAGLDRHENMSNHELWGYWKRLAKHGVPTVGFTATCFFFNMENELSSCAYRYGLDKYVGTVWHLLLRWCFQRPGWYSWFDCNCFTEMVLQYIFSSIVNLDARPMKTMKTQAAYLCTVVPRFLVAFM